MIPAVCVFGEIYWWFCGHMMDFVLACDGAVLEFDGGCVGIGQLCGCMMWAVWLYSHLMMAV